MARQVKCLLERVEVNFKLIFQLELAIMMHNT